MNGKQDHVTVQFGTDAMRYVEPGATTVLRYADRVVWRLDDKEKTVREVSLDSFLRAQKEKSLQPDLPDLERARAENAIQVERTEQRSDFGGVAARLVRIRGEGFDVDLWMSDAVDLPGPRRPTFELLQALGGPLAMPAVLFDHLPGFPVRSMVHVKGGMFDVRFTRSILSLTAEPPPASVFDIPADYRRVDAAS